MLTYHAVTYGVHYAVQYVRGITHVLQSFRHCRSCGQCLAAVVATHGDSFRNEQSLITACSSSSDQQQQALVRVYISASICDSVNSP